MDRNEDSETIMESWGWGNQRRLEEAQAYSHSTLRRRPYDRTELQVDDIYDCTSADCAGNNNEQRGS